MRTSSAVIFTLFAASASRVFGAPVALSNHDGKSYDSQLVPRLKLPASLEAAGNTLGQLMGPPLEKALSALGRISAKRMDKLVGRILGGEIYRVSDDLIQAVYKSSNKHSAEVWRSLQQARQGAINSVTRGAGTINELILLRALGKGGDKEAIDAIKMANLTPEKIKHFGLEGVINPSKVSAKKIVGGAAVVVAGGAVAVGVLAAAGVALSQLDFSYTDEYPNRVTVSNGAIPETDQRQILAAIEQQPESYPRIMQRIREYKGITAAEITLFENADPAKKGVKRSFTDLD